MRPSPERGDGKCALGISAGCTVVDDVRHPYFRGLRLLSSIPPEFRFAALRARLRCASGAFRDTPERLFGTQSHLRRAGASSNHVAALFLPNSLRTQAATATTAMMTNFLAPRRKIQSPLKRPSFAATPPATNAAMPYEATLSPDASLKSA